MMQITSAVGYFLLCTIAKMGIFKALQDAQPLIGPMHYVQCVSSYKSKWLRSLKSKVGDVYNDVIKLYSQPRQNTL